MLTFTLSFLISIGVFAGTAICLGWKKAITLPGGSIGACILFTPVYIAVIGAIIGHVLCSFVIYHFKERKKFEWTKSIV